MRTIKRHSSRKIALRLVGGVLVVLGIISAVVGVIYPQTILPGILALFIGVIMLLI